MGKRVNCTKKERKEVLKKLGKTEEEMQAYWDELVAINHRTISALAKCGRNWTDLIPRQMMELPTLKEKTLKQREEKRQQEEEAARLAEEQKKQEDYYNEHFEEIMVEKMDKDELLTESEIKTLVYEFESVDHAVGDMLRWTTCVSDVIELCGRYFKVDWYQANTEMQEDEFLNQPYEVKLHEYEKTIIVKEWEKI